MDTDAPGAGSSLDYPHQLELVNGWIENADSKIGNLLTTIAILTGFMTLLLGGQLDRVPVATWPCELLIVGGGAAVFLTSSLIFCLVGLLPRLGDRLPRRQPTARPPAPQPDGGNPLFFGDVAQMSRGELVSAINALEIGAGLRDCYLQQIHANSLIAAAKFRQVRYGALCLVASMILHLTFSALLAIRL